MLLNCLFILIQFNIEDSSNFNSFIDKNNMLALINLWNLLSYTVYKIIKLLALKIQNYLMQAFLIFIYNNMSNIFLGNFLSYFFLIKKDIYEISHYLFKRIIKIKKINKFYYRFYLIDYLKIIFYLLFILIFILMWKRRNTYKKSIFLYNLVLFYVIAIFLSFLITPLFSNSFIGILIPILISFVFIFLKLN